jgi:hypothetical protein
MRGTLLRHTARVEEGRRRLDGRGGTRPGWMVVNTDTDRHRHTLSDTDIQGKKHAHTDRHRRIQTHTDLSTQIETHTITSIPYRSTNPRHDRHHRRERKRQRT